MSRFEFERECRTPYSECYTVLRDEDTVGRVDIHFADGMVHSTLNTSDTLSSDDIQDLIDTVDTELIGPVASSRQDVIVHVHQGRDLGAFRAREFEGEGGGYHNMS